MHIRLGYRNILVRAAATGVFLSFAAAVLFLPPDLAVSVSSQSKRARNVRTTRPVFRRYSSFPHNVKAHTMACNNCHKFPSPNWKTVRAEADAFPDITEYPRHESCLNCHKQQFFRGPRPAICSICHVNPSPRDGRRHPFPNPREKFDASPKGRNAVSDFGITFNHSLHVEIVSGGSATESHLYRRVSFSSRPFAAEESCAVCHKTINPQGEGTEEYQTKPPANLGEGYWLKRGTFKSVPTGHATCFTCHSAEAGLSVAPNNCASCHSIKPRVGPADFDARLAARMGSIEKVIVDAWKERDSTGKFRHEFAPHADLSCSTCHNVETMNTLDAATKRVGVSSCSMCHATATADEGGALTMEFFSRKKNPKFECSKCHVVFGKRPVPATHLAALKEAGVTP